RHGAAVGLRKCLARSEDQDSMSVAQPEMTQPRASTGAPRNSIWAQARRNPTFMIGAGIVVLMLLVALLAPLLAPYNPYSQSMGNRLVPPVWAERGSWAHILGTDGLGRDYF